MASNRVDHRLTHTAAAGAVISASLLLAGCTPGVHWRLVRYEDAYRIGQREARPVFVYFRSAFAPECPDFEEHILKDPEVLSETNVMVCVPLEFLDRRNQQLAGGWQIVKVPGYAIVAPDGRLLAHRQAPLARDDLLRDMRAARNLLAAEERTRVVRAARHEPPRPPPTTAPGS